VFDLRYHVASLVAVFLMLVVGILVGVGISGRGFVDDAERRSFNDRIANLQEKVDAAAASAEDLQRRQQAAEDFVTSAYPVLADRRLDGKHIVVLVVGSVGPTLDFVERALHDSDAGPPIRMRAIKLPLRLDAIESTLLTGTEFGGYVGQPNLGNLGRDLGRELAGGGPTPLWDALSSDLVEERSGSSREPADAVVVIRDAGPQQGPTSRFLAGLYSGVGSTGAPAVGVEPTQVEQSAMPVFQRHSLSTVDGIDTELGRLALVLLLGGASPGHYGARDSADDGILPPIEPLPSD
jgi:hypothetical protein